jgi:hypothetical protein
MGAPERQRATAPLGAPAGASAAAAEAVEPGLPRRMGWRTGLAVALVVAVQAAIGLYLGLPGQLSTDSIIQLYEGRTGTFISWNPPLMSLLLGALDRLGSGPVGFVLLSQAMLSAATALALSRAAAVAGWRLAIAAVILLNPVVLFYAGIVWKDVLLAHSAVLLYMLLAWMRFHGKPLTVPRALLLGALLIVVAGARQQGPLFALPAALWAGSMLRSSRSARIAVTLAFLAIPIGANRLVDGYASRHRVDPNLDAVTFGLRYLIEFDIAGILAHRGQLPAQTPTEVADDLRAQSLTYSRYRVDTLGPAFHYWTLDDRAALALWRDVVAANPGPYLRHRAELFTALLGLADMSQCLPLHSGISGPVVHPAVGRDLNAALGLAPGSTHAVQAVVDYGIPLTRTPLFVHAVYVAVLAVVAAVLVRRREFVPVTLAACAVLLLGSYLVLGIACDFRYAYPLTVTTTILAAYVVASSPGRVRGLA